MAEDMNHTVEDNWCFVCGKDNPIGLHLDMHLTEQGCYAYFVPKKEHESYGDRMHGGLISTLLDEVMGDYIFKTTGIPAYTARIEIRFRKPVRIGERIKIEGKIVNRRGRLYETVGTITTADGTVAAEAKAKMMSAGKKAKG